MATAKQAAAAARMQATERKVGINSKSVAAPAAKPVGPAPSRYKPRVITQNRGQVYANAKLVGNYGIGARGEEKARAAAASYASDKGNIAGNKDGSTYRKIYGIQRPVLTPTVPGKKALLSELAPNQPDALKKDAYGNVINPGAQNDTVTEQAPEQASPASLTGYTETEGAFNEQTVPRPVLGSSTGSFGSSPYMSAEPEAPRSQQDIRQEQLSRYQSVIDATQALYNSDIQRINQQGSANQARAGSMAVGAGLAGSPFQQTIEASAQRDTEQQVQARTAERTAQVSNLLLEAENSADELYQRGLDEYQEERSVYIDERDKALAAESAKQKAVKDSAISSISTLAKGGYSIDEIPPAQYRDLLAKSGMSDFEARATWAAQTPEANATYTTQNGFMVGTYFDPQTGKPVVTTTPLPAELMGAQAPDLKNISLADGSVIFYDANQPYNVDGSLRTISYAGSDVKKSAELDAPASYDEWSLAGGLEGTGKTYAQFITESSPTTAQQNATFNSIVGKFNASPLIAAADRTPVLEATIEAIKATPDDAALQMNLAYAYIQALDTYQSAVREGELSNLNSIDSKIGVFQKNINKLTDGQTVRPEVAIEIANAANLLLTTIKDAASQKARSFESQAQVSGVGDMWGQYMQGFDPSYAPTPAPETGDSGIQFDRSYSSPDAIIQDHPELQGTVEQLREKYDDGEILQFLEGEYGAQSFNPVGTDTNTGAIQKLSTTFKPGSRGGQCGRFVNQHTGLGMGDSFESKMAKTNPSIGKPGNPAKPGDVFVMKYDWTGHTGFIKRVIPKANGLPDYEVIDSNYGLDEKVKTHIIPGSKMAGFARAPINV